MKSVHDQLREHAYAQCGASNIPNNAPADLSEVRRINWSTLFVELMRNRMLLGFYRYGSIDPKRIVPRKDRIGSAIRRLKAYQRDGNQENLVDVANLCMVEFRIPNHPRAHFDAIDDGEHCESL